MNEQVYTVRGMTCEGCVGAVTSALEKVPNVERVEVSLEKEQAVVVAPPGTVADADVVAAVAEAGYEAEPLE
jgi:copper chaperone CopZ